MTRLEWVLRAVPPHGPQAHLLGHWNPTRPADITAGRRGLSAAVHDGARPPAATEDAVERLLLAFEELVSNAVRHGQSPVRARVTATGHSWLLEVTDQAGSRPPTTDDERDPALGGLGLDLVASLSGAHGWEPLDDGGKVVWARLDYTRTQAPSRR
ncbi:ATP-binding protein [Blastococcus sp. KM273129]|uniref:ATP-binding protein n=1 Tax=Blastococcus sp. KM273129 TaxID=2570315 RepID=UPI001F475CBB|nr:ATP-binding protein [Blastococcus sp. KM273129]MCF6733651.1 ATP-binding protein [Blastococcus sp. KM273129]